jgi:Fanconi anemia group M protein
MSYDDIKFNPKGDLFPFMRDMLIEKGILSDGIDVIVDSREPDTITTKLNNMGYNVEIRTLEVGDYVFEGGTAFERKKSDFLNFQDVLQKSAELKSVYKFPYLIVELDVKQLISQKSFYGHTPPATFIKQISGLISSLTVRGVPPIFCSNADVMVNVMTGIAKRNIDGKDRTVDYKMEGFRTTTDDDYTLAMYGNLPSIGPNTARALKEVFPSMEKLMSAEENDLLEIEGIGPKRASDIYRILHEGD